MNFITNWFMDQNDFPCWVRRWGTRIFSLGRHKFDGHCWTGKGDDHVICIDCDKTEFVP